MLSFQRVDVLKVHDRTGPGLMDSRRVARAHDGHGLRINGCIALSSTLVPVEKLAAFCTWRARLPLVAWDAAVREGKVLRARGARPLLDLAASWSIRHDGAGCDEAQVLQVCARCLKDMRHCVRKALAGKGNHQLVVVVDDHEVVKALGVEERPVVQEALHGLDPAAVPGEVRPGVQLEDRHEPRLDERCNRAPRQPRLIFVEKADVDVRKTDRLKVAHGLRHVRKKLAVEGQHHADLQAAGGFSCGRRVVAKVPCEMLAVLCRRECPCGHLHDLAPEQDAQGARRGLLRLAHCLCYVQAHDATEELAVTSEAVAVEHLGLDHSALQVRRFRPI
mmetsp:Transcript_39832/g.89881  ORF Transcript_39832/g.89881 Transcript_39832/m.89881 type:complete len:334 (-) Transcript_39832:75-1076(-)